MQTDFISTSHTLAKELLNKPDGFIFAKNGEIDYVIENIQRISTNANMDDGLVYWILNLRNGGSGNIKR